MDIEKLFRTAVGELEQMLSSKTVIGDPISVEGATIIPLVSVGFGFGVGGGTGKATAEAEGEGTGGGTGGGGGVKPVAIVIIDAEGVRVEPVKMRTGSVLAKVVETVGQAAARRAQEGDGPGEGEEEARTG